MNLTFYDETGTPTAYCEDGEHVYLFSGEPVAYFSGDAIYSFSGNHIGWFENGWIRDTDGNCAFFTDDATGGPIKPIKAIKPIKGIKQIKPIKGIKSIRTIKAIKSISWSDLSAAQFFDDDA